MGASVVTRVDTPLRGRGEPRPGGWRLLSERPSTVPDPDDRVLAALTAAPDVSLATDSLAADAANDEVRRFLDPAGANVVRALAIPAGARVLTLGGVGGVIARHLGEIGAVVDAIEPTAALGAIARERNRDIANVEVFVGALEDVPDEPGYDLIVAIGVLEEAAGGVADRAGYVDFLARLARRLVPDGTLALGAENKMSVKALVGAPDEHSGRVFDSVESYPYGTTARSFSRRELEAMIGDAGLRPTTLGVFPDVRRARSVLHPRAFPEKYEYLLSEIPGFPSPDATGHRPRLAHEGLVWGSFVRAGLAADASNAFLVLASNASGSSLWPDDLGAVYFSEGRRSVWSTVTRVRTRADGVAFACRRLAPGPSDRGFVLREYDEKVVDGENLVTFARAAADEEIADALGRWSTLLDREAEEADGIPLDFVPHNMIRRADGSLQGFDQEWYADATTGFGIDDVRNRGVLWFASRLATVTPPERWPDCRTVGDLARRLGSMIPVLDAAWIDDVRRSESRLLAEVRPRPSAMTDTAWRQHIGRDIDALLASPLAYAPLGQRDIDARGGMRSTMARLGGHVKAVARLGARAVRSVRRTASRRRPVP